MSDCHVNLPQRLHCLSVRCLTMCVLLGCFIADSSMAADQDIEEQAALVQQNFARDIKPALSQFCFDCHNVDNMESGIRVDHLDGTLPERSFEIVGSDSTQHYRRHDAS